MKEAKPLPLINMQQSQKDLLSSLLSSKSPAVRGQTVLRTKLRITEKELKLWDFPGGPVVEDPPARTGDMGSIPGPGRLHVLRNNYARVPQLLRPVV